jgi:Flp pilus assembly CpaE family ATPase
VVVDLPRSFDPVTAAALTDTDRVLIITQLTVASIRNATRLYQFMCEMGTPEQNIGIVLNRAKTGVGQISEQDVEKHFGRPLFAMIPNDYQRVQSSLDRGHAMMADDPNSPVRLAIHEMARNIAADVFDQVAVETRPRSLFSRLWRRKAAPAGR